MVGGGSLTAAPAVSGPTAWIESIKPEPWVQDALCAETDAEAFFPEKGGSVRDAKRICNGFEDRPGCPVREQCLQYALARDERFGIWGGASERDRRQLKRDAASEGQKPRPGQPYPPALLAKAVTLWHEGLSDVKIAERLGVNQPSLSTHLRARGYKPNGRSGASTATGPRTRWTSELDDRLRELKAEGLTDSNIAARLGVLPGAVLNRRTKLGIPGLRGKRMAS